MPAPAPRHRSGPDRLDLLCLPLLLLIDPVTHHLLHYLRLEPDTIAYLALAEEMGRGRLVLEGWGHVDTGAILPPLYPALIALATGLGAAPVDAALLIPRLFMLGFALLAYLYLRREGLGRLAALAAVASAQAGYAHLRYAMAPLTDAGLIFTWMLCLLALQRLLERPTTGAALRAGLAAGLCFLARQPGLVLVALALLAPLPRALGARGEERRAWLLATAGVAAGAALLLLPYATLVWQQSGQLPLRQFYRLEQYRVTLPEGAPAESIRSLRREMARTQDYQALLRLRREALRLLPDASETYGAALLEREEAAASSLERLLENLRHRPAAVFARLRDNLLRVAGAAGPPLAVASLLLLAPLPLRLPPGATAGWPLAASLALYLAGISALTSMVERYVLLLVPFLPLWAATRAWHWGRWLSGQMGDPARARLAPAGLVLLLAALIVSGYPRRAGDLELTARIPRWDAVRERFAGETGGAPVFAAAAFDAYLSGGSFRSMPNAGLAAIACYARRTGVRWLVRVLSGANEQFRELYRHAAWYLEPTPPGRWLERARELRFGGGGLLTLYRIRWPQSPSACSSGPSQGS